MKCFNEVEIIIDKKSGKTIYVQRFDDGTEARTPIDPNGKFCVAAKEFLKAEHNKERKHRYWVNASLDGFEYEGELFADNNTPATYLNLNDNKEIDIMKFYELLTETQKRRLSYRLNDPKISYREIAKRENTSAMAICKTFEQIRKLFEKFQLSGFTN